MRLYAANDYSSWFYLWGWGVKKLGRWCFEENFGEKFKVRNLATTKHELAGFWSCHEFCKVKLRLWSTVEKHVPRVSPIFHENLMRYFCSNFCLHFKYLDIHSLKMKGKKKIGIKFAGYGTRGSSKSGVRDHKNHIESLFLGSPSKSDAQVWHNARIASPYTSYSLTLLL